MDALNPNLGPTIRGLRTRQGLTQSALGTAAGYLSGAGVTISRIENGQLNPSADRLEGIARALGTTAEELTHLADSQPTPTGADAQVDWEDIDRRIENVQLVNERQTRIQAAFEEYTEACNQANRAFLGPLLEIAARVDGIPSDAENLGVDDLITSHQDAQTEAKFQLGLTRYAVNEVLANPPSPTAADGSTVKNFTDAVALSTIWAGSTLVARGALRSPADLGATLSTASRMRSATSTAMTVLPAIAFAAGAFAGWLSSSSAKRIKRHQESIETSLANMESDIEMTRANLDGLEEVLREAIKTLDYVKIHAGHALKRWGPARSSGSLDWGNLDESDRTKYLQFVEVAAAQLTVASLDIRGLVEHRGRALEQTRAAAGEVITQAWNQVTRHV